MTAMLLVLLLAVPGCADAVKTVKIGYYEDHNFQGGAAEDAAKYGYSYEYLQRLQPYTDWEYEYVYGDYSEIYDALVAGEIDIITGLAYREERTQVMLYPDLAMGNTVYSLLKRTCCGEITSDPQSVAGKRIGVLVGAMEQVAAQFLTSNGITAEIVLFESLVDRDKALQDEIVDVALVEGNATAAMEGFEAVIEIGGSDYYACVAKNRPDLLADLNKAQERMFHANPTMKADLYTKWFRQNAQDATMTDNDRAWVDAHPVVKVGYYKSYLPYSSTDKDGNVTGIVKDLAPELFRVMNISGVKIEYQGYDTCDEMLAALNNYEVDMVFPLLSEYWTAENTDYMPADPVISNYYNIIYKGNYPDMDHSVLAMRRSNGLVRAFQKLHFPCCEVRYYDTLAECLDAVVTGEADATMINGLRTSAMLVSDSRYKVLRVSQVPGTAPLSFGARRNESQTIEFLNHAIGLMDPDFALAQTYQYEEAVPMSAGEFIRQNVWLVALPFVLVIVVIIIFTAVELTRSRKHMAKLTAATREAEAANRAKTEFLSNMSHDIRTPMNAILGYSRLVKNQLTDPKLIDYHEKIEHSGDLLVSIINNVLDMARIESGKTELDENCMD
ncbi:MAG: transporter substrate-binding domain-containing protein, partial [Clostridia bacterium]|nr:transporter substrate-binding domain-containing protein [Clostridia bacterium]